MLKMAWRVVYTDCRTDPLEALLWMWAAVAWEVVRCWVG